MNETIVQVISLNDYPMAVFEGDKDHARKLMDALKEDYWAHHSTSFDSRMHYNNKCHWQMRDVPMLRSEPTDVRD